MLDYALEMGASLDAALLGARVEAPTARLPEPPAAPAPREPDAPAPPPDADDREAEDDAPVAKPRSAPKEHGRTHTAGKRDRGRGGRSTGSHRRPRSPAASRLKGRGRPMAHGCARHSPGVKGDRAPPGP
jgi:hypothetical protein